MKRILLYLRRALASLRAGVGGPLSFLICRSVILIEKIQSFAKSNPQILFSPECDSTRIIVTSMVNERTSDMGYTRLFSEFCRWSRQSYRKLQVETDAGKPSPVSLGCFGDNLNSIRDFFGVDVYSHSTSLKPENRERHRPFIPVLAGGNA